MDTIEKLKKDLTTALKERDDVTLRTVRSLLGVVQVEEKSGKSERTLGDDEVIKVLSRELKKRRETATVFTDAGRPELAARESEEAAVIEGYLPSAMGADEVAALVRGAIAESGASGPREMGKVMGLLKGPTNGRVDGSVLSAEVRAQLSAL